MDSGWAAFFGALAGGFVTLGVNVLQVISQERRESSKHQRETAAKHRDELISEYSAWFRTVSMAWTLVLEAQVAKSGPQTLANAERYEASARKMLELFGSGQIAAGRLLLIEHDDSARKQIAELYSSLGVVYAKTLFQQEPDWMKVIEEDGKVIERMATFQNWLAEHRFKREGT